MRLSFCCFGCQFHEDERVLLDGEITSRAEKRAINGYFQTTTMANYLRMMRVFGKIQVRNSFLHGRIQQGLAVMAVYAAGCEILHDFHSLAPEVVHEFLAVFGTSHAVAFIALSHICEHYKEYLEEKDGPNSAPDPCVQL